jgi:cytochrome c553
MDKEVPRGKGSFTISPFIPSKAPRPYLPGDPQDPFASPLATVLPRAAFAVVGGSGSPRSSALAACEGCHGADGAGRQGGAFPNLTLQTPQYLYDALNAFASGQRQSGVMWPVAASLSDEDMRRVATQLGTGPSLPSPAPKSGAPASVAVLTHGEDIAATGIENGAGKEPVSTTELSSTRVERCTSCHLSVVGLDRVVPRIEGQNAAYLRMQLRAFRDGGRGDTSNYDPMGEASHNLNEAEIESISEYYAARAPVPKN